MPAVTYQDVILANLPLGAWALAEAAGVAFAPYKGGTNLAGTGTFAYQQAGPFAASFGLQINVGAKLALAYTAVVNPPFSHAAWYKLAAVPPAALIILDYWGNAVANGAGLYIDVAGHLHLLEGGVGNTDTGLVWPDTNWHMLHWASNQDGKTVTIAIDGVVRWRGAPAIATAPAPNTEYWGGDSATVATVAHQVAWPTVYAYEIQPPQMAAEYYASIDPAAAISGTLSGSGATQVANSATLDLILAAVRKTY